MRWFSISVLIIDCMQSGLPYSALLSQAYVAYAIEFDNEFEHQVPHRTTNFGLSPGFSHGGTSGFPLAPWLVAMPMWLRFMRYVPIEGITAGDLQQELAISNKGLQIWLTRLGKWWGYLTIEDPARKSSRISPDAMVRPTAGGRKAIEVWRTLIPMMETRWRERFGGQTVADLEEELKRLADQIDPAVPAYFQILESENEKARAARMRLPARELAVPELLTKVLLGFAAEFDAKSMASLAVCANVLRITPDAGIRVRDLSRLAYLSREGVADALRQVAREGLGAVQTDPSGGRGKILMIMANARLARDSYVALAADIEQDWKKRFGTEAVNRTRALLEEIVLGGDGKPSPLLQGVTPYADGWRARLAPIEGLPHFPMVSHRGGFPDGS